MMSLLTRGAVFLGTLALVVTAASTVTVSQASDAGAAAGAQSDPTATSATALTLVNGWQNYGGGTRPAGISKSAAIGTFTGAIRTSGTSSVPFVLPTGYRPQNNVYVPVDLCNATKGRLLLQSDGSVEVQAATDFANAQCFTSLDGVTYPILPTAAYTALSTINGWTGAPFGTSTPGARNLNNVIYLKGAIATSGSDSTAFRLPVAFRPKVTVYVKVDMCDATNGRLIIQPDGFVIVQAENDFADAQCFTSLDGVTYALNSAGYSQRPTINGWSAAGFGTRTVGMRAINGVVHLQGSIQTSGTNASPFTVPVSMRPPTIVYLATDTCGATNGRIVVSPNGSVNVQAENDFSNAACFTSLEGVTYALS